MRGGLNSNLGRHKFTLVLGLLFTTNLALGDYIDFFKLDYGQCQRQCRDTFYEKNHEQHPDFEEDIVGKKVKDEEKCECTLGDIKLGTVDRLNPLQDPPPPGEIVCAEEETTHQSRQFDSLAEMPLDYKFLNNGPCGKCSNSHDIEIYKETAQTLTNTTTNCAFKYVMFGEHQSRECFEHVGLTPGCSECWIDNIGCDAAHCVDTCLVQTLRPRAFDHNNNADGDLNECLKCDEQRCGTAFIKCAGANRRRAGIESDIGRKPSEIAKPMPGEGHEPVHPILGEEKKE